KSGSNNSKTLQKQGFVYSLTFCSCKMALSDILFCYIQYGRDSIPVSCIYIFIRDFGNWSGWYRIYVAKGFYESVWSKIYMEFVGV
ncbi:hypothetical protein, partial [Blautia sp. OM07-19]|uniref:hypothetical protein n=1 Tax=Blautia sp. OM07-19 TaxID=2292985 RepID=UPI002E8E4C28